MDKRHRSNIHPEADEQTDESPEARTRPQDAAAEELEADQTADGADSSVDGLSGDGSTGASTTAEDAPAARAVQQEREKYLRLAAEFDNYRKRSIRERQEAGWRAQSDLVLGLIDALDDIMRFAHLDPATVDSNTVVQGVAIVEKKLIKSLGGHGLEILNPIDQLFDPAFHEAVGTEAALSSEDDHLIAKVYQPGYVFRGQLLRPARVVVKQWTG